MATATLTDLAELPELAKKMLKYFDGQKIIAFYGELGAGKTTLIKAICKELGVTDVMTSPTFSIVNEYRGPKGQKIYHFDFFRLQSVGEAYDMGYEEYFYSGAYCFIEWPEKIAELLPLEFEKVRITKEGETRTITF
ncbi:MAG TPA: tRNA (adenosine(37)-N6)-threonylcarbamoyltransferase complex ATPase subunit type 1 TsaE [Bacteroidia bacterium]|jgi:tRNA threonylcarbamoyladenosine biosynthesis protein TsaE